MALSEIAALVRTCVMREACTMMTRIRGQREKRQRNSVDEVALKGEGVPSLSLLGGDRILKDRGGRLRPNADATNGFVACERGGRY